jgi:hypothetical protein
MVRKSMNLGSSMYMDMYMAGTLNRDGYRTEWLKRPYEKRRKFYNLVSHKIKLLDLG